MYLEDDHVLYGRHPFGYLLLHYWWKIQPARSQLEGRAMVPENLGDTADFGMKQEDCEIVVVMDVEIRLQQIKTYSCTTLIILAKHIQSAKTQTHPKNHTKIQTKIQPICLLTENFTFLLNLNSNHSAKH